MGIAEYHQVDGKTVVMPIDESHDSILKCAKKVARRQFIEDTKDLGKHWVTGMMNRKGDMLFLYPIKEWQEKEKIINGDTYTRKSGRPLGTGNIGKKIL